MKIHSVRSESNNLSLFSFHFLFSILSGPSSCVTIGPSDYRTLLWHGDFHDVLSQGPPSFSRISWRPISMRILLKAFLRYAISGCGRNIQYTSGKIDSAFCYDNRMLSCTEHEIWFTNLSLHFWICICTW